MRAFKKFLSRFLLARPVPCLQFERKVTNEHARHPPLNLSFWLHDCMLGIFTTYAHEELKVFVTPPLLTVEHQS